MIKRLGALIERAILALAGDVLSDAKDIGDVW